MNSYLHEFWSTDCLEFESAWGFCDRYVTLRYTGDIAAAFRLSHNFTSGTKLGTDQLPQMYTVCGPKIDMWPRNMLIIKNPQFSPNFDDTLPKWSSHGMVILTKCHKNWVKIVDFLLIAYFWAGGQFCWYIVLYNRCL